MSCTRTSTSKLLSLTNVTLGQNHVANILKKVKTAADFVSVP